MKKHLSDLHDTARGCLFGTLAAFGILFLVLGVISRSGPSNGTGEEPTTGSTVGVPTMVVPAPVGTVPHTPIPPNAVETEAPLATERAEQAQTSVAQQTADELAHTPVREVNYGTWRYELSVLGGDHVSISDIGWDGGLNTVDSLKKYIEANKSLVGKLATGPKEDQVETVEVYFDYASPEDVNTWVASASGAWHVKSFELLVFDPTGKNWFPSHFESTFRVSPSSGPVALAPESVQEEVQKKQQEVPEVQLEGVYSAEVSIARRRLPDLVASSLPLLVEVTPLFVRDDLEAAGLGYSWAPLYAPGLHYVSMEDMKRLRAGP